MWLGLDFVSLGFTPELGGGGGATLLRLLKLLALKVGTGSESGVPVNEGWLNVPVWDSCEKVGFGNVVNDPEEDGKVLVKIGLLKVPVKEDSWRLATDDGGGGREKEPVGMLNELVGTLKLLVNEPEGGGGREKEPVGALCDS